MWMCTEELEIGVSRILYPRVHQVLATRLVLKAWIAGWMQTISMAAGHEDSLCPAKSEDFGKRAQSSQEVNDTENNNKQQHMHARTHDGKHKEKEEDEE